MIIRVVDKAAIAMSQSFTTVPHASAFPFGRIDVLRYTSSELQEYFRIRLADRDVATAFQVVDAVTRGTTAVAALRKDHLARVLEQQNLLPCFVAYQEVRAAGTLPFLFDGPSGQWSLFFEAHGSMTLAQWNGSNIQLSLDHDLFDEARPHIRSATGAKAFLLRGVESVRKRLARADEQ